MMWKGLTRREARIVLLVMQGVGRHEVAADLGISTKTFDSHRGNALRKIGVRSEVEALRMALVDGMVRVEEATHPDGGRMVVYTDLSLPGEEDDRKRVVDPVCTCEYTTGVCALHGDGS